MALTRLVELNLDKRWTPSERQRTLGSADVRGEAADPAFGQVAVHRVARLKLDDLAADRHHLAGNVGAEDGAFRPA